MQEIHALDLEVKRLKEIKAIHKEYRRYVEMPSKLIQILIDLQLGSCRGHAHAAGVGTSASIHAVMSIVRNHAKSRWQRSKSSCNSSTISNRLQQLRPNNSKESINRSPLANQSSSSRSEMVSPSLHLKVLSLVYLQTMQKIQQMSAIYEQQQNQLQ